MGNPAPTVLETSLSPDVPGSVQPQTAFFKAVGRVIPYFRNPKNVLIFKLDIMLIAWLFLAGLMKEMDQSATTQAYVSGMREDLNLRGNELVQFNTFFSIGYALGLVPGQLIQTRIRPSLYLPTCEVLWGFLVLFTYKAQNAQTIFALRFFQGLLSAAYWPTAVSLVINWYTPKELALRITCCTISDVAGAMFLGVLQAVLYRDMNGVHGLAGWQWLFIIAGSVTVGQGVLAYFTVPDSPSNTRAFWLTSAEKRMALERMQDAGIETSKMIPLPVLKRKLRQLISHPITYLFILAFAFSAWAHRATGYFVLFLESIKDSEGNRVYDTFQVNVLPLGGYALTIVTNLGFSALSDYKLWRWQISVSAVGFYGLCIAVLCGWPSDHRIILAFYFLSFLGSGSVFMAWMAELLQKEPEGRSILISMTVTLVYVGHATIPLRAFRVADSPRYPIGFPLSVAFVAATILVQLGMAWYDKKYPELRAYGFEGKGDATLEEGSESGRDTQAFEGVQQVKLA